MRINGKAVLPAIGLSMAAGAVVGMALTPKKDLKNMKHKAEKALRSVGHTMSDAAETITDAMM